MRCCWKFLPTRAWELCSGPSDRLADELALFVANARDVPLGGAVDGQQATARRVAERQVHPAPVLEDALVEFQPRPLDRARNLEGRPELRAFEVDRESLHVL